MSTQFKNQKYINVETFRKNGEGVKIPVWFVEDSGSFFVWTEANSWKVRRIRNNGKIKIAPSTASGEPISEWVEAHATADASPDALEHVTKIMKKKYDLSFAGFRLSGKLRKANYTAIRIQLDKKNHA